MNLNSINLSLVSVSLNHHTLFVQLCALGLSLLLFCFVWIFLTLTGTDESGLSNYISVNLTPPQANIHPVHECMYCSYSQSLKTQDMFMKNTGKFSTHDICLFLFVKQKKQPVFDDKKALNCNSPSNEFLKQLQKIILVYKRTFYRYHHIC